MDLVVRCSHMPLPGETLLGDSQFTNGGGKGANQAVGAAKLGAVTRMIGRVGTDANGAALKKMIGDVGIDVSSLYEDPENPTGLAIILLENDGANRIIVLPGANMAVGKQELDAIGKPDALMMQLEIPRDTVIAATKYAVANGIVSVVDAGPAQQFPLEELRGVTILSPNETEAAALCGFPVTDEESALAAAKLLQERCEAKYIVLKRGSDGASLWDGREFVTFPACKGIRPVDTTAAGDCFTAALTLRYLETDDIKAAIRYANYAAALKITRLGAQTGIPTAAEVEAFIAAANA